MKFRGTLLMLVVAVGFASYLFYSERQSQKRELERDTLRRLAATDDIESMTFAYSGKVIVLNRRPNGWVVSHPVSAPCDPRRIGAFVDTLRAARVEERVGSGDLERYGLATPAAEMTLQRADGSKTRMRFGRINPLQTLVYARLDDSDDVILTSSSLLTFALTSDFGWRDKRMTSTDPAQVTRMRFVASNAGSLTVRHDPVRGWVTENRDPWRIDPLRVTNVLRAMANLEAVGVAAENKEDVSKYGLNAQTLSAVLEGEGDRPLGNVTFGFARSEGTYYAMVPHKPEIFLVSGDVVKAFVELSRDYRDRKAFPRFDAAAVTRLEVVSPTDSFAIERRSVTRWVVSQSSSHDSTMVLDPGRITTMLEDLMTMQIVGFPEEQPPRALVEPPEWRIDLYGEQGWLSGLEIGQRDPNGLHTFVRGTHDAWWVHLPVTSLIALPFDLERYGTDEVQVDDGTNRG